MKNKISKTAAKPALRKFTKEQVEQARPRFSAGAILTLSMDYWNGIKKGTNAMLLSTPRRDKNCRSGFMCVVRIAGRAYDSNLDANWFAEYPETEIVKGGAK